MGNKLAIAVGSICALVASALPTSTADALFMGMGDHGVTIISASRLSNYGPPTARVNPGEGLWHVAERHCGDGRMYPLLADYNNVPGPDFTVHPDQRVKLPYRCR